MILEARGPKERCWLGHIPSRGWRGESPPSSSFWWLRHSLAVTSKPQCLALFPQSFVLCVCVVSLSLIRTRVIGFNLGPACLDKLGWSHLKILHLIISAKAVFPNRAPSVGSRAYDMESSFQGGLPFASLPQDVTTTAFYDWNAVRPNNWDRQDDQQLQSPSIFNLEVLL